MITNNRIIENRFLNHNIRNKPFFVVLYPFLRQALFLYLKNSPYSSVALPYYCPEGIYDPFLKSSFKIYFYDVDEDGYIDDNAFSRKVDLFVYIHYFGIYNFKNINKIIANKNKYRIFIEDFAHTVYTNTTELKGDICTFSFTKMIGVIEGASIINLNHTHGKKNIYTKNSIYSFLIRFDLMVELFLNSYFSNKFNIIARVFRKVKSLLCLDYYKLLMATYEYCQPNIGKYSKNIIDKIDFEMVSKKRIEFATLYYRYLDKSLLMNLPKEYYLHQALFAFPIKVKNRDSFMRFLMQRGIQPFYLSDRWHFGNMKNCDMINSHLLLPINHNLNTSDIMNIIGTVNDACMRGINEKH